MRRGGRGEEREEERREKGDQHPPPRPLLKKKRTRSVLGSLVVGGFITLRGMDEAKGLGLSRFLPSRVLVFFFSLSF